jgi:hypothetical protein
MLNAMAVFSDQYFQGTPEGKELFCFQPGFRTREDIYRKLCQFQYMTWRN